MRTIGRFGALGLLVATAVGAWWLQATEATAAVSIRPNVEVVGATSEQLEMVRWAIGRFGDAGLEPPSVKIAFHTDESECNGHIGFAKQGRVDVCSVLVNAMSRRTVLHEMSHIWLDRHVHDATEARFLALRDLHSWNASNDAWRFRGCEQGAEIVSWALGERILSAQIPDNDVEQLAEAFELLTGRALPA
jgi:hypothetical protein